MYHPGDFTGLLTSRLGDSEDSEDSDSLLQKGLVPKRGLVPL